MAAQADGALGGTAVAEGRWLRVGDHEIDIARRVVSRPGDGGTFRLTLKSLQVLLALVEAEGRVVSREQLLATVWPNTLPTDDVLTQAVAQLRRAFEDSREAPRYIETIAKGGYRLLATPAWILPEAEAAVPAPVVQETAPPPQEAAPVPPPARGPGGGTARASVLALALVAIVSLVAVLFPWPSRGPAAVAAAGAPAEVPPPVRYQAIASTPMFEQAPALSPDGSLVVFSRQAHPGGPHALYLQPPAEASARQLTFPGDGAGDQLPAWSRDGRRIAFVRSGAGGCRLMVVAASGGGEREVGRCEDGHFAPFDWSPDGTALVMGGCSGGPDQAAPLRRLDLATGRWEALPYEGAGIETLPRYSPDGQWLGFRRGTSLGDLWLVPAAGGTPRQLTRLHGDIRGWDWLPDGSGLVFSLIKGEARLYRLALADGAIAELPPLARGNPIHPDIADDAWAMAFEIYRFHSGLYAFGLDGATESGAHAEPVFASSGVDMTPAISPDGSTLAFVSDRSLAAQLWIGEIAQPQTLRAVPGIVPVPRHPPVWSPDGRRLLVIGATGKGGDRLFEVDVGLDTVRVLPVPGVPAFAAYPAEPDQLLVGVDGDAGRMRLVRYQLPDWRELASLDDVAVARYDRHGDRVCFTRPARAGLWCADPSLGKVAELSRTTPLPDQFREWAITGGRIFSTGPAPGCATAWTEIGGKDGEPVRCMSRMHTVVAGSTSVDEAARRVYLSLPLEQNIDVGWASLEPLRPPAPAGASD
ncbi:winged helix-turn-helix domain-containing protein [Pseudoxanthomonas sp. J35]|uniref:winged helix-turn-helix domain-containing protein n=1 Tax=Pseudoxanthomonas sp. J35 TaxID=935852 RepID=UPI0004B63F2A|nr:winged helix-turn-helix domain-containing protein [Pseudoxanthomonas sp. J35]